jgi:hypothetical protein
MSSPTSTLPVTAPAPAPAQLNPAAGYTVRALHSEALTADDLRRWSALEADALEPNAYASPHFILPALRHLDAGSRTEVILIERADTAGMQTVGACALTRRSANRTLPLPHTEVYQSLHTFCGAPLIAKGHGVEVWTRLLGHIRRESPWSSALVMKNIEQGGGAHRALAQACDALGYALHDSAARQRAMLLPPDTGAEALKRNLRKQHAEIERCRRRVAEGGELNWHIHRQSLDARVIEDFLRLEHSGWKGEEGSSLRSHATEEAFFREVAQGFASQGRALFTELRLGDQTIASTSNFVSGATGFAFKVGWDPAFRKHGIGILNEAELVRHAPEVCADLQAFDSGAEPASFIEKLWPGRRSLVTSTVLFNRPARWAMQAVEWVRVTRERSRSQHPSQAPAAPKAG